MAAACKLVGEQTVRVRARVRVRVKVRARFRAAYWWGEQTCDME